MLTLTALLLLSLVIRHGLSQQSATCYKTSSFSCSGVEVTASSISDCCDQGFLSFTRPGTDPCEICPGNVICHGSADCSDSAELGLGAMSRDSCCTNSVGGQSYTTSSLQCTPCPPRTPDPTTATPTTLPPTTMATETTTMATETTTMTTETTTMATETSTEEISVPGNIVVVGGELAGSPVNIGAVVGGVIGSVVAVATITTITVVVIVLLVRARPSPV